MPAVAFRAASEQPLPFPNYDTCELLLGQV